LELQMVTAKPVRTDFGECGGAQQLLLYSPGYQQVESSTGTLGAQCGQLKHQYKAGDARMEKLLLTVWEAAERT
jgi:excisionase family DNA binding protein